MQVERRANALIALAILFAALVAPSAASAADRCTLRVDPATVQVGEAFLVTGTRWEGNETVRVSIETDTGHLAEVDWSVEDDGTVRQSVTASGGQVGWGTITVVGDTDGCEAGAAVVVLAPAGMPPTDTVPQDEANHRQSAGATPSGPPLLPILVGAVAGFLVLRSRRPRRIAEDAIRR